MDFEKFDGLTRSFASRRAALTGLAGGVAALLGLVGEDEAIAHNAAAKCRKLSDPIKRRQCLRRARAHNRRHRCKAKPTAIVCGGRCGTTVDNCGKQISCPGCAVGKTCLGNGSCSRTCVVRGVPGDCPAGCGCGIPAVDGGIHCIPLSISQCDQIPQVCTVTAQCPVGTFCGNAPCGPDSTDQGRCIPVCPG